MGVVGRPAGVLLHQPSLSDGRGGFRPYEQRHRPIRGLAPEAHRGAPDRSGPEILQPAGAARVSHLRPLVGWAPRLRGWSPLQRQDEWPRLWRSGRDLVVKTMLIAGDIGGTKTDLAIYSPGDGPHAPLAQSQFHSADYPSLQAMVAEFLTQASMSVQVASFDVAGPVIDGHVRTTNLPWTMDEESLARDLKVKSVHLMNDLEAVARSVPVLRPNDVITLNEGRSIPKGPIAVIAPGTGLGESFLTWDSGGYQAHSSEGGHSDFAPTDERQIGLLKYLFPRFGHVAFERVCSGIGLPNIYEYLRDEEKIPESPQVAATIASAKDRTKAIMEAAFDPL